MSFLGYILGSGRMFPVMGMSALPFRAAHLPIFHWVLGSGGWNGGTNQSRFEKLLPNSAGCRAASPNRQSCDMQGRNAPNAPIAWRCLIVVDPVGLGMQSVDGNGNSGCENLSLCVG